jgi:hypothetical protein
LKAAEVMPRTQRSPPRFAAWCAAEPGPYQAPVFGTVPVLRSSVKNAASRPGHRGTVLQRRRLTLLQFLRTVVVSRKRTRDQVILDMTDRPLANFDLEKAIALRWALRDIVAKRLKLAPLKEDDLQTLIELGFVEMRDGAPVVTQSGLAALE